MARFKEDGCELHPSCLNCPLPSCPANEPYGMRRALAMTRAKKALIMHLRGKSNEEIALDFGVSIRTVQRWLKIAEEEY